MDTADVEVDAGVRAWAHQLVQGPAAVATVEDEDLVAAVRVLEDLPYGLEGNGRPAQVVLVRSGQREVELCEVVVEDAVSGEVDQQRVRCVGGGFMQAAAYLTWVGGVLDDLAASWKESAGLLGGEDVLQDVEVVAYGEQRAQVFAVVLRCADEDRP